MNTTTTDPIRFITFEGLDSSGKTTQAQLLVQRLEQEGYPYIFLRDPGGTAVSEKVRDVLLDRTHTGLSETAELFLFCAARTQLVTEVIKPALAAGKIVISDRFIDSTTAYQGYGRQLDLDEIAILNKIAIKGTSPDITLFIDVEVGELILRRQRAGLSSDRMESSGRPFFERVRRGYLSLADQFPRRIVLIDGMQSIEQIEERVWREIADRIPPVVR